MREFYYNLFPTTHNLIYSSLHIEFLLIPPVMFAFENLAKRADRIGEFDVCAGGSCKSFSDEEWLLEEALNFARAVHESLVVFG